tara:strand:+ start:4357 stop:6093 length:1737 start_codon:yes stop_codon:yes gene_type:complete
MTLLRAYLTGETDPFILTKYLLDEIQKKETLRDLVAEVDESALNELEESKYKSWVETILNKPARFVSADADKYEELERALDSLENILPAYSSQIDKIRQSIKNKRESLIPGQLKEFEPRRDTDLKKILKRLVSRLSGTDYLQRYKNIKFTDEQLKIIDDWPNILSDIRTGKGIITNMFSPKIQKLMLQKDKAESKMSRYESFDEEASKTMKDEISRNKKKVEDLNNKVNKEVTEYLNEIKDLLDEEHSFGRPFKEVLKQIWKDKTGKKFLPKQSKQQISQAIATRGKTRSLDYWMRNMDKDMSQETKEALKPKLKIRLDSYNKKIETANKRHLQFYDAFATALEESDFNKIKKNIIRAEETNRKYNNFRRDILNFSALYEMIEGNSPGFDILPFTFNEAMDNLVSLISEYARRDDWGEDESVLEELAQSYSSQVNAIFEELGASELTRDYSGDTILQTIASNLREYLTQDESEIMKAHSPLLDSLDKKKAKRLKKILQAAEPSEYFGQDFAKLGELIKELKALGFIKEDKKKNKRLDTMDEKNVSVVATAAKLRKDYEVLYRQLRGIVYPKSAGGLND